MPDNEPRRDDAGNQGSSFGLSFTLVAVLAICVAVGFLVDRVLGTMPVFLLVGVTLGFVGGLYYVYQAVKKLGGG